MSQNPAGLINIDHLEFAVDSMESPTVKLFSTLGFTKTAEKDESQLYTQGQVRFLVKASKNANDLSHQYFKNHGDCLYRIFTGRHKENGALVTNLSIQFIRDAKLYTFIGNCMATDFPNNHKEFLNAFESLSL